MNKEMRFLLDNVRGWRKKLIVNSFLTTILIVLDIAPQLILGRIADVVTGRTNGWVAALGIHGAFEQIVFWGLGIGFVFILRSIFGYMSKQSWNHFAQTLQHKVRTRAYGHVQNLDVGWFKEKSSGTLLSILHNDVGKLENFFFNGIRDFIEMVVSLVVTTAVCYSISPNIAFSLLISVPLMLVASSFLQRYIYKYYRKARKTSAVLHAKLNNYLQGITIIKSYGLEHSSRAEVEGISKAYREHIEKARSVSFMINPVIRTILLPCYLLMLIGGGWLVTQEKMSAGNYVTMILLITEIEWPIRFLGPVMDHYQSALASAKRIGDLLKTRPLVQEPPLPVEVREVQGKVELEKVSFGYEDRQRIFEDISLSIPSGGYVGFVGTTGVGKSTLIKLLLRFYDPNEGKVKLEGIDVKDMKLEDVRKWIGLVDQSSYLFDATIRVNLTCGNRDIGVDKINEAIKMVALDRFIEGLKEGYDTGVGEHGIKLSQGQKQRLCIARALLKDPKILVFDEATSAVDNETEKAIQDSLFRLKGSRTIIVIAHRLSTVRFADKIYVLGANKILESGTHEELVKKRSTYSRLWDIQTGNHL